MIEYFYFMPNFKSEKYHCKMRTSLAAKVSLQGQG